MKGRGFFKAVAAGLCALFAGKALADLPSVGAAPEPGKWTRLVIIRQNGHWRIFVDGKLLPVQYWSEVEVLFEPESELAGQSLSFAGVDDYVDVPSHSVSMSDAFTIDAWIPPVKGKELAENG